MFFPLLLLSPHAGLTEQTQPEHIKILFGYRFPPFYTVTSKKDPSSSLCGVFINILEKFKASHPQYTLEYKCLPRARITKVLRDGEADAFALSNPMFLHPEIKSRFSSSIPLWSIGDHLLVRKDSPIKDSNISSLLGKKIAVLHGNGHGPIDKYFENGMIKKHAVYSTPQILELVLKGRVDGAICNKTTLPALMNRAKVSMKNYRLIESPLYTFNLHLLVKRQKSNFLRDFDKFIQTEKIPEI
nr:transporter substrate-binding domain-containing protein [Maridesulfovibrio hydrothermalis]